jgi:hypothetical protein
LHTIFRPPKESRGHRFRIAALFVWRQCIIALSNSYFAVPLSALLAGLVVGCFYLENNAVEGGGEPFAWSDGTSAWPSIGTVIFAALLSVHFILKGQNDLTQNASDLTNHFGLRDHPPESKSWFGWAAPARIKRVADTSEKVDIVVLWERYLFRGRFLRRMVRVVPMTALYVSAIYIIKPLIGGDFPSCPIRGSLPLPFLLPLTIIVYLVLTFFVIDSTLLHRGFLEQLGSAETYWPDTTFKGFEYPVEPGARKYESELGYFWDILLISRRTQAVGNLIYYPFVVLFCLIVARLPCFDNWTWTPLLLVALSMHFSLALFAAWRLPKAAVEYRDKVLRKLSQRRRKAFMIDGKTPEAIDTMIEEVQSNHQGAFAYLWDQPAIRALLLPSGGIGLATLLQFLPH